MSSLSPANEVKAIIAGNEYLVTNEFNMVGNWVFTDKNGVRYLVDSEDIQEWADSEGITWNGSETAIAYAQFFATETEDGVFWWKISDNDGSRENDCEV